MGLLEAPVHADFVMGVLGGIPATALNLAAMAANMPAGRHHWGVIGIGRVQWMMIAAALNIKKPEEGKYSQQLVGPQFEGNDFFLLLNHFV